ncbi:hypothetical protein BJ508DRAFT_304653 [Ascobolus immersus RN42]|uniref:C3H1-type domain-containing protein n=1 Tax=Ascobolus immersus RN42 TaxID=1160509 RepID=A0A3N4IBJ9_ASCIM|nr:hypothetical protein BJ508DRAFT_304653 [Ascobolus immersus RN42]
MPETRRSTSKAPSEPTPSNSEILSSLQTALTNTLTPLTERMERLESQLAFQAPLRPPMPEDVQEDHNSNSPTQQLHQELEGGVPIRDGPQSVFSQHAALFDKVPDAVKTVELWFSGVKSDYIRQILRNEFIPTDINKLIQGLGAKTPRTVIPLQVNEAGTALELASPAAVEEDYAMWTFFQAWEVYRSIFLWGSPMQTRGQLASSLCIYTNNLHKLRRSYSWPAARAYHFAFHQLRVSNASTAYDVDVWRRIDPDLVAEHCMTAPGVIHSHPAPQSASDRSRARANSTARFHPYEPPLSQSSSLMDRVRFPLNNSNGPSRRRFSAPCDHYNSREGGCNRINCRFAHACNRCGKFGHGAYACSAPNASTQ